MTIEVALVISALSLAFGIYQGVSNMKRNQKADNVQEASQMTTVIVKLETISAGISEIKSDMASKYPRYLTYDQFNDWNYMEYETFKTTFKTQQRIFQHGYWYLDKYYT